jgi:hypothetical protein
LVWPILTIAFYGLVAGATPNPENARFPFSMTNSVVEKLSPIPSNYTNIGRFWLCAIYKARLAFLANV